MKLPNVYLSMALADAESSLKSADSLMIQDTIDCADIAAIVERYAKVVTEVSQADLLVLAFDGAKKSELDLIDVLASYKPLFDRLPSLILMRGDSAKSLRSIVSSRTTKTALYTSKRDIDCALHKFIGDFLLQASRIVFLGAPGSAKNTLARRLKHIVPGLRHISSIEQLLCTDNEAHQESKGFILDEYPLLDADGAPMTARLHRQPDIVVYLECAQITSIARQMERKSPHKAVRHEIAALCWKTYQQNMPSIDQLQRDWFPKSLVCKLDTDSGVFNMNRVYETILGTLLPRWDECYTIRGPVTSAERLPSDRFNVTIDGDARSVFAIVKTLSRMHPLQLQLKPIEALHPGPQVLGEKFASLYSHMCQYREALDLSKPKQLSAVGSIGRAWSPNLPMAVAQLAQLRWEPLTVTIEQVLLRGTLSPTLDLTERRYAPQYADLIDFMRFCKHRLTPTPMFQLHIGFDLAKKSVGDKLPIYLHSLTAKCTALGMCHGAWLVLASKTHHKYRASEFASTGIEKCSKRLKKHAARLQRIVSRECGFFVTVSFQLSAVHSIYTFR